MPGSIYLGNDQTQFCVWSPQATSIELHLLEPQNRFVTLEHTGQECFYGVIEQVAPVAVICIGSTDRRSVLILHHGSNLKVSTLMFPHQVVGNIRFLRRYVVVLAMDRRGQPCGSTMSVQPVQR